MWMHNFFCFLLQCLMSHCVFLYDAFFCYALASILHILLQLLKVPSDQIGSAWEWYHWIGLEKDINHYRFFIFIFYFEYLIRLPSSAPLHTKINPTSCLFGSRFASAQTVIFPAELCSKNAGKISIVLSVTALEWRVPTSCIPNQNRAAFWRIFSSNKSAPASAKTGF